MGNLGKPRFAMPPADSSESSKQEVLPERQLLLLVARPDRTEEETARLRALVAAGLDWNRLERETAFHHLELGLWKALYDCAGFPESIRQRLRMQAVEGAARNLRLIAMAGQVFREFRQRSMSLLVLKGPVLAQEGYGDVTGRLFSDIDVLVHPADAPRALQVLRNLKFEPLFPIDRIGERRYLKRFYEISLQHPTGAILDLHWSLLNRDFSFAPTESASWSSVRGVCVGKEELPTLSIDMTARYLCLHVAKHHWDRLGWLSDVAHWMFRQPDVDWPRLAAEPGTGRYVAVTLQLIEKLFDRLPACGRIDTQDDPLVAKLSQSVANRLLSTPDPEVTRSAHWRTEFGRAMPTTGDRWRSVVSTLFRPSIREWIEVPLPWWLSPLYVFIRPARLLWSRLRGGDRGQ